MSQETFHQAPVRYGGKSFRWLACFAALLALAGSLWAALGADECGKCHAARALLTVMPLAWAGVAYYGALALAAGWRGLTRATMFGFFAAVGVHVVLVSLLVRQQLFCGACIFTASAALLGAVACLAFRPRTFRWAAVPVALATLLTVAGVMVTRSQNQTPAKLSVSTVETATTTADTTTEELPDGDTATRPAPGRVKLVLYEREGCKHCLQFDEDILPQLQKALGSTLEIEHRPPTLDMETPTIVVVGTRSTTFTGVPDYEDLERAAIGLR